MRPTHLPRKIDFGAVAVFCRSSGGTDARLSRRVDVAGALKQTQKILAARARSATLARLGAQDGICQAQNILSESSAVTCVASTISRAAGWPRPARCRADCGRCDPARGRPAADQAGRSPAVLARARAAGAAIGAKGGRSASIGDLREFNLRYRRRAPPGREREPALSRPTRSARARLEAALAVCAASGAAVDFAKIFEEAN